MQLGPSQNSEAAINRPLRCHEFLCTNIVPHMSLHTSTVEWRPVIHYNDIIINAFASQSPASRLFIQLFIQTQIKENIKAPRHWPLCGEFTGDRWIPAQVASNAENVSIWWLHHIILKCLCHKHILALVYDRQTLVIALTVWYLIIFGAQHTSYPQPGTQSFIIL